MIEWKEVPAFFPAALQNRLGFSVAVECAKSFVFNMVRKGGVCHRRSGQYARVLPCPDSRWFRRTFASSSCCRVVSSFCEFVGNWWTAVSDTADDDVDRDVEFRVLVETSSRRSRSCRRTGSSEHGQRIERRSGAFLDAERGGHEEEFVSIESFRLLGRSLEVEIVEDAHAHRN